MAEGLKVRQSKQPLELKNSRHQQWHSVSGHQFQNGACQIPVLTAAAQAALLSQYSPGQRSDLVIQLQRIHGNLYVQRLLGSPALKAQFRVSQPDGLIEREAGNMTGRVAVNSTGNILQRDKTSVKDRAAFYDMFYSEKQRLKSGNASSFVESGKKPEQNSEQKTPPPVPTSRPWKKTVTPDIKIRDIILGGNKLGSRLNDTQILDIADFAHGVKYAGIKNKTDLMEYATTVDTVSGTGVQIAGFGLGQSQYATAEGSKGYFVIETIKNILGPIPDAISTVIGIVRIIYNAVTKKSTEAWEAVWDTTKSAFKTVFSTAGMILKLIGTLGGVVPIVGGIGNAVAAIVGFFEAVVKTVKRAKKWIQINTTLDKLHALIQKPFAFNPQKGDMTRQERYKYLYEINDKRRRNIRRDMADQFAGIFTCCAKLTSAVLNVVGGLVSLGVISAPIGAIVSAFGTVADIFGYVFTAMGKIVKYLPKVLSTIRQWGRNLAAKENWLGRLLRSPDEEEMKKKGTVGRMFGALKFNIEKSARAKDQKRFEVIHSLVNDANNIQTVWDRDGKDKSAFLDEVRGEIPKYENLDFELDAISVNKGQLFKFNNEQNLGKRMKGQISLIFKALKAR